MRFYQLHYLLYQLLYGRNLQQLKLFLVLDLVVVQLAIPIQHHLLLQLLYRLHPNLISQHLSG
ncbi:hypothetical protein D3C71_1272870 [compost metagenome]